MSAEMVQDNEVAGRLREIRERVRAKAKASFAGTIRQQKDEGFLYGDRDLQHFPQLRQHLAEVEALWNVQEQPFRSHLPLLGPLIAWFRERWNRISTKWYVLPILQQQVQFNAALARTVQDLYHFIQTSSYDLVRRMDAFYYPLDQEQAAIHAAIHDLRSALAEVRAAEPVWAEMRRLGEHLEEADARREQTATRLEERIAQTAARLEERLVQTAAGLEQRWQEMLRQQEVDRRGQAFLRMKVDRLMALIGRGGEPSAEERAALAVERESLRDYDYYRFEDTYRHEEEVREQQKIYLPFFQGRSNVLDLGCGKGEFLELLRDHGIAAYGVDLNEEMVRVCREKGLRVIQEDAFQHLAGLPDGSLGGLFAAHLVEHLPPAVLVELVQLAQAKLQAGAYLIFETPNPLCLWALVNYFYLDMSHVKPVHPQALSFLLETHGFRDVEVRYLHPVPEGVRMALLPDARGTKWQAMTQLINTNLQRLNDLLYGNADYAIIARK